MSERAFVWIVRTLARLYPPRFRREYGADLAADAAARWKDAAPGLRRMRVAARTATDLVASAVAERRYSSFAGSVDAGGSLPARRRRTPMQTFMQDLRFAGRMLRRSPGHSLFLILTIAVGIGSMTAVFTVVDAVLLAPLPFPQSDRLVAVWGRFDPESGFDFPRFVLSNPEFLDYRHESRMLADVAAWTPRNVTVGGPGAEPERVPSAAVSANLFAVLRTQPMAGRTFTRAEDLPGGPRVALISYGYWQARFGADPGIVGRSILLNGMPHTVVGIMPSTFTYPSPTTRIWVPLAIDPANPGSRSAHSLHAIGRLADGATLRSARAELHTLMADWKARFPAIHTGHYLFIRPLIDDVTGEARPALLTLLAATGFVLLIVCVNVANLLLARGEARTREMTIRAALGARRAALVRTALVECVVVALLGGALAVAIAVAGVRTLVAIDPGSVPRASEIHTDWRMLAFAAAVSLSCAFIFGLMPAWRGATAALQGRLGETSRAMTAGSTRQTFRRVLVASEVGLSVVLVIGAGLMLRSFDRLMSMPAGFNPDGLLMASVALPAATYRTAAQVDAFYGALLEDVRRNPAVRAASAASGVPLWSDAGVWDFEIEGHPSPPAGAPAWNAAVVIARPGLLETLQVPLVRGRFFTAHDDARSAPVSVISDAMARRFFAGEDPIGRRIRIKGVTDPRAWMTIVGIAADVRSEALGEESRPTYYLCHEQIPVTGGDGDAYRAMSLIVRVEGDRVPAVTAALRTAVRALDPALPLFDIQTVNAVVDRSVARPRFTTVLLGLFALIGVALGATGVYGVLSYAVARRTQEIGIRRALGAPRGSLTREIVVSGMQPVAIGLAVGAALSIWTTKLLTTELFGVTRTDPPTYVATIALIVIVALAACVVPAWRALAISPLIALRAE